MPLVDLKLSIRESLNQEGEIISRDAFLNPINKLIIKPYIFNYVHHMQMEHLKLLLILYTLLFC